jgi:predicted ATPase
VKINNLKRFSDLTVEEIPSTAKLILLVGSNGSGKTSFFEAFNLWYQRQAFGSLGDQSYFDKKIGSIPSDTTDWGSLSLEKVQISFHDSMIKGESAKGKFYFRSAYRNEPDFIIQKLEHQENPTSIIGLTSLMENDTTVSKNYQRLIGSTISAVYDENNDAKNVKQLREDLIGKIKNSLSQVFPDLNLSSIGDPLLDGSFYFEKGNSKDFHYKNLSAGEKSAFDLILDLIMKSHYFDDAIYCVDEPESHMHTRLQGKVLRELYSLVPDNSQLWISTHSIGMLKEARNIERQNTGTVVFLDFDNRDFDSQEILKPTRIDKAVTNKFYDLAFGDFASLMLPKQIVFCEGAPGGRKNVNFDMMIYNTIFEQKYPDTQFISVGSSDELEKIEIKLGEVMTTLLRKSKVIKIIDRDDRSDSEVAELSLKGINVLSKRHIECYLLDDSIISLLCSSVSKDDKKQDCLEAKTKALNSSISRGNPIDDIKSASGEICNELKRILDITQGGNNTYSFLRDTIAPLITEDTDIFKQLEQELFKEETVNGQTKI